MKRRTNAQRPRGVPLWLLLATVVVHTAWTQQERCCCCCCFVLLHARTPDMMQSACMLHNIIFFHAHALIAGAARVLMSKCCSCCPVCYDEDEGGASPLAEAALVIVLMHMDAYHDEWNRSLSYRHGEGAQSKQCMAPTARRQLSADSMYPLPAVRTSQAHAPLHSCAQRNESVSVRARELLRERMPARVAVVASESMP